MRLPAITVWQPWASLIAIGAKPYEFRGWVPPKTYIGQRIAIHAGARKPKIDEIADLILRLKGKEAWTTALKSDALAWLEKMHTNPVRLVRSAIVCTAILDAPKSALHIVKEFGGHINDSDRDEHCNFAWPLTHIELVLPPQPVRGAQGFWSVELDGTA